MAETVRIDIFIKTVNNKESGIKSAIKNLEEFSDAANHAGGSAEGASNSVTQFDKAAERTQKNLSNWAKEKMEILSEARTPVLDVEALGEQMGIMDIMKAADSLILSAAERLVPYVKEIMDYLLSFMPLIEVALEELMDFVEINLDRLKRKIKEVISGEEWENADLLGKVKIAWDEIIAVPFIDWWNSDGRIMINEAAGGIGNIIGSVFFGGLLLLFGKEASDFIEEGDSVGRSFVAGFAEGFDLEQVGSKFLSVIKNMFSNALKVLPGGESPELSSVISAMLISKIVSSLFGMGIGAAGVGKGLLSKLKPLIGSVTLTPALDGSGIVGGTGLLGGLGKVGMGLGSGATTGGGLALAGGAAITGAVMAQATMISGALDVYKAFKSESKKEAAAYGKSAVWKVGGVATGAAAGAAIGSVVPVIGPAAGALIGAGIGGVAGWVQGNKVKEEYKKNVEEMQKEAERAQKIFELTGQSIDNVRFKNEALTEAMKDSGVSAEEFAKMFREACDEVGREAFGDIKLSLAEVKKLAGEITFGDMAEELNYYTQASSEADSSQNYLTTSEAVVKKELWKGSLGGTMSGEDIEDFKNTANKYVDLAQAYVEDKHYEATLAFKVLLGEDADTSGLDSFYNGLITQAADIEEQVKGILKNAFNGGEMDEEAIKNLTGQFEQLQEMTNMLSEARITAQTQAFEIKHKGTALDLDSFRAMQEELVANSASLQEQYDDALMVTLTNLYLQRAQGDEVMTEDYYNAAVVAAKEKYYKQINEGNNRITSFSLGNIADAYGEGLNGLMPGVEGTNADKLKKGLEDSLLMHPDVAEWTEMDVINWMGLDKLKLSDEQQNMIATQLIMTARAVPRGTNETLVQDYNKSVPTVEEIKETIDFTKITYGSWENVLNSIDPPAPGQQTFTVTDKTKPLVDIDAADFEEMCNSYAERLHNALEKTKNPELLLDFKRKYMGVTSDWNWGYGKIIDTKESRFLDTDLCRLSAETEINSVFEEPFEVVADIKVKQRFSGIEGLYKLPEILNYLNSGDFGETHTTSPLIGDGQGNTGTNLQLSVQAAPVINITEQKGEKIVQIVKQQMVGMTDKICEEVANNLENTYSNMPLTK